MRSILIILLALLLTATLHAQTKRVLFLGNSYTGVNNLPNLIYQLALSGGDTLMYDSNTPGGCTFGDPPNAHIALPASYGKIDDQDWDYVVLQEQSQIPTIAYFRDNTMYPGARRLNDSIQTHLPCRKPLFYMTWGRQFGGQQCAGPYCSPVFTDFNHMTDSLHTAYMRIANELKAPVAPVGMAWKAVRNDTSIVLHQTDQSHPNMAGSYLAACTFYAAIWQKTPIGLTYTAGLDPSLCTYLQTKAHEVVLDHLTDWNLLGFPPLADFSHSIQDTFVYFTDSSQNATQWQWDFGDGQTATTQNPVHQYAQSGLYTVTLIVGDGCESDTITQQVNYVVPVAVWEPLQEQKWRIYPNPVNGSELHWEGNFNPETPYNILDLQGKVHQTGKMGARTIHLGELPAGTYLLKVQPSGEISSVRKFQILR